MERREDDGGRGYVGGTTAAASAMARESEGEVQGANGCPGAWGGAEEALRGVALARRHRQAGRWRGELGGVAVSLLGLLAEVGGDWHGPDGPARPGKWPPGLSLSLFLFNLLFYFSASVGLY